MRSLPVQRTLWSVAIVSLFAWGCTRDGNEDAAEAHHAHDAQGDHAVDGRRGPKGGRLFEASGLQLELVIEEEDHPPLFVAWLYDEQGEMIPPASANLAVTLHRLGNRVETVSFQPVANHLRGAEVVGEPHSFAASIELEYGGELHRFDFEQHEFRVELTPEAVERAEIVTQPAGPAHIDVSVTAPGEVHLNREQMLFVQPRFAGVVTEMRKRLGDPVKSGDVLAVIQSNNSLTEYTITAPMPGNIVARSGMVGATVEQGAVLYTLADLSSVWVDFAIYPQHVGIVKRGHAVTVRAATQPNLVAEGEVSYVGPLLEEDTRVSHGRIVLPNMDGRWQPGLYVNVTAVVDHAEAVVSVPDAAIVRSKFGPAVFIAEGATFEVQPVTPGRTDGKQTEILEGLVAGDLVVVQNAYLLKAELGRAEATHDH